MRLARVGDNRRRAAQKKYSTKISYMEFQSHSYFENAVNLPLSNPTVILGKNGSGKTRLLKIIEGSLKGDAHAKYDLRDQFSIKINYHFNDLQDFLYTYRYHQGKVIHDRPHNIKSIYINAAELAVDSIKWVVGESNFDELIDQYEPYIFPKKELELINYCSNKNYTRIEAFSITDIDIPMTYFIVQEGNKTYGTEAMGTGELSILTLFFQIKQTHNGTVVLIEEPENFLTYSSQFAIMDVFRHFMLTNDNFFIISTHSSGVLLNSSRSDVIMLYEKNKLVSWVKSPSDIIIKDIVGIDILPKITIHVEDKFAYILLDSIIAKYLNETYYAIEINIIGSESNLKGLIDSNLIFSSKRNIVCFDGDCKLKYSSQDRVIFLPSEQAPEREVLAYIGRHIELFCTFANISSNDFSISIDNASSIDHHDAIDHISKSLNLSYESLSERMCDFYSLENSDAINKEIVTPISNILSNYT